MIIKVQKYLIYGLPQDLSAFFERAQQKGFIEFIGPSKRGGILSSYIKELLLAIKILRRQPLIELPRRKEKLSAEEAAKEVVALDSSLEKLNKEMRGLQKDIEKLSPFGNFSFDDVHYLQKEAKRFFQFFCRQTSQRGTPIPETVIYVTTEFDLDYFVGINRERIVCSDMIEIEFTESLAILQARLQSVKEQIKKRTYELKGYAAYIKLLRRAIIEKLDDHHLESAKRNVSLPLEDKLFFVEAWVPSSKMNELKNLLDPLNLNAEQITIEKSDRIPTYLENERFSRLGEDLVNIYDTPSIEDKDPSPWVMIFFTVFFSMIIADAGYGLIFLLLGLLLKFKIRAPTEFMARFTKLVLVISTSCIIWGIATASFLGITVKPGGPFSKVAPIYYLAAHKANYHLQQKDDVYKTWSVQYPDLAKAKNGSEFLTMASKKEGESIKYEAWEEFSHNILLEVSLLIGVLHIVISFALNWRRNLAGIGWIFALIGGYLWAPKVLDAASFVNFLGILDQGRAVEIGSSLAYGGMGLAVLLSFIQKKAEGFKEILNIIGIFADVMSYLRLYALGLAGIMMSETFNNMASGNRFFLGIFIILLGHGVNIVLSIMSGTIHGLRLNFIEWYHYCFEGGGKLFSPLKLLRR